MAKEKKGKDLKTSKDPPQDPASPSKWSQTERFLFQLLVVLVVLWASILAPKLFSGNFFSRFYVPSHLIPFRGPSALSAPLLSSKEHLDEFFWGTYRPQVYFGVRGRIPKSPLFGMMWTRSEHDAKIRHTCEQGDGLEKYGWLAHNGRDYASQLILDSGLKLKTQFVKQKGPNKGNWAARITGESENGETDKKMNLLLYLGTEEPSPLAFDPKEVVIEGFNENIGDFSFKLSSIQSESYDISYLGSAHPHFHNLTSLVQKSFKSRAPQGALPKYELINRVHEKALVIIVHLKIQLPFSLDLLFAPKIAPPQLLEQLRGEALGSFLQEKEKGFQERFNDVFQLEKKGFSKDHLLFAQAAFSNLIGGIGYFYGHSLVKTSSKEQVQRYWDAGLYTAVPSRSFFPRGFLWDEGFHQLLIGQWDWRITSDVVAHWLDLMNKQGWIPREQILGDEARSKVPPEFVVQNSEYANPPTLLFPIRRLLLHAQNPASPDSEKRDVTAFLKTVFPRLQVWFGWYNTTQQGPLPSSYRWRGRDPLILHELNPKTLTSGFDDYPRASHPSPSERHVDLRCWVAEAARILAEIAELIGESSERYSSTWERLRDNQLLNKLHWDEKAGMYSDFGNHTDAVELTWQLVSSPEAQGGLSRKLIRSISNMHHFPQEQFVSHFGYVSLFPFLLKIVDTDSPQLGKILEDLRNPRHLWTKYGLRSLSASSSLYMKRNTEHDAPYWRGPIWINMNYLVLAALHHYGNQKGPYQQQARDLYQPLRENVIRTVFQEYQRTGYVWEQYEQEGGKGKGCHPFTGWSSLVVLLMAEAF